MPAIQTKTAQCARKTCTQLHNVQIGTMKTTLIWNDGKTESGKPVQVLATMPVFTDGLVEPRDLSEVLAIAVPHGESWKVYDMRADGKMVRCGRAKTWPSLTMIKEHFENR